MHDYTATNTLVRRHADDPIETLVTPQPSIKSQDEPSLFCDPTMGPSVDFQSQDGFQQAAGKKAAKKAAKAAAKSKWEDNDDEDGNKKDEEEGGDGGDKGGDAGAGGGGDGDGDGDKKDGQDGNGADAGDGNPDDEWGTFITTKPKKKGKKGKEEPAVPASDATSSKFDAFHEIKLDDTGPMLDLSFDTPSTSTKNTGGSTGFGAWGSSWNTGTTNTWDFSSTITPAATETKAKDTEIDNNPWSLNRGKPKKKNTGFSFGALDEEESKEVPDPPAETKVDEDAFSFGFTSVSKKDKKKKKGVVTEVEEPKEEITPPADDPAEDEWGGWGTAKSKKKGGKKIELEPAKTETKIEETAPVEEEWSFGNSKKDKKKKKGTVEEPMPVAEPEKPVEDDFSWGSFGTKKDKVGKCTLDH